MIQKIYKRIDAIIKEEKDYWGEDCDVSDYEAFKVAVHGLEKLRNNLDVVLNNEESKRRSKNWQIVNMTINNVGALIAKGTPVSEQ